MIISGNIPSSVVLHQNYGQLCNIIHRDTWIKLQTSNPNINFPKTKWDSAGDTTINNFYEIDYRCTCMSLVKKIYWYLVSTKMFIIIQMYLSICIYTKVACSCNTSIYKNVLDFLQSEELFTFSFFLCLLSIWVVSLDPILMSIALWKMQKWLSHKVWLQNKYIKFLIP